MNHNRAEGPPARCLGRWHPFSQMWLVTVPPPRRARSMARVERNLPPRVPQLSCPRI
ncbi:hypothetical protein B0H10DRAFT_439566 [Mycena sp. CBHHK59/15]|nr:hypothetical protein B0H10DRAFT_439566 [Mycena sp. CBHHK59/15]